MLNLRRPSRHVVPLCLVAAACGGSAALPEQPPAELTALPRPLTAAERQAVVAGNEFSLALLRAVDAEGASSNVAISPFSASVALGMTLNGARAGTLDAMRRTLGLGDMPLSTIDSAFSELSALLVSLDPSITMVSANAIFHAQRLTVRNEFTEVARRQFDATVRGLDFADEAGTLSAINGWASDRTRGRIPTVLDKVPQDAAMFLMNALYFKGAWRTRFSSAATQPGPFHNADGTTSTVPLMRGSDIDIRLGESDGVRVAELPYGSGAFVLDLLLPPDSQSVGRFVASLTAARWTAIIGSVERQHGEVILPRFTLRYEGRWNDALTQLGMGVAFTDAADFGGLFTSGSYALKFVKQNVLLEVNEEGTEAAAVTTEGVVLTAAPSQPFRVDRPFAFAIRERLSGTILFVGAVRGL